MWLVAWGSELRVVFPLRCGEGLQPWQRRRRPSSPWPCLGGCSESNTARRAQQRSPASPASKSSPRATAPVRPATPSSSRRSSKTSSSPRASSAASHSWARAISASASTASPTASTRSSSARDQQPDRQRPPRRRLLRLPALLGPQRRPRRADRLRRQLLPGDPAGDLLPRPPPRLLPPDRQPRPEQRRRPPPSTPSPTSRSCRGPTRAQGLPEGQSLERQGGREVRIAVPASPPSQGPILHFV